MSPRTLEQRRNAMLGALAALQIDWPGAAAPFVSAISS